MKLESDLVNTHTFSHLIIKLCFNFLKPKLAPSKMYLIN